MATVNYNEKLQALLSSQAEIEAARKEAANMEITRVLTFNVGDQIYGIEIPYVVEIIEVSPITAVPNVPDYIKGIINVRSKIVPVVNIRTRFGKPEIPFTDRTCVIHVTTGDVSVGLIVDSVADVISATEKHISRTPELNGINQDKFIKFIIEMDGSVKLVLDVAKLIEDQIITEEA